MNHKAGQLKLDGTIALVTGGSRGIGLAIAQELAREGVDVVLVARDAKALEQARNSLKSKTGAIAADVREPRDVDRVFKTVQKRYGRLDVLVNCAGVFTYKPFPKTTLEDWRNNIETNLTSLFLTTKAALPLLARAKRPQIVNILSVASQQAFPNCSAYAAAKFGALGLTRVLREELRAQKIRVTAIFPGPTETEMIKEFGFEIPSARLMQPEDVAAVVVTALKQPVRTAVEEISLRPAGGSI